METLRLIAEQGDEGLRLDQFLALHHAALSRRQWRQVITLGGVHAAGRRMSRVSRTVRRDEEYTVYLDGGDLKPLFHITADTVIHEDDDLLAVNKPAGVEAQPTPARYRGTVFAAVRDHLKHHGQYPTIGLHSRLDRDVSGVMVLSISRRAHKAMTEQFRERSVHKTYLAVVSGRPPSCEGRVESGIARVRGTGLWGVDDEGKEAVTLYRLLSEGPAWSLVAFYPLTGRTHQVRIHARHLGSPILGDRLYGEDRQEAPALMLHAGSYAFTHPVTGTPLSITAPPPPAMVSVLRSAGITPPDPLPERPGT